MKKKCFYLLTIMMVSLLSIGFASCSSDDDDDSSESVLVGHWQECEANGIILDDAQDYEVHHMRFYSNEKGDYWSVTKGKEDRYKFSFNYTYTLEGSSGKIALTITSSSDQSEVGMSQSVPFTLINGIFHVGEIYYKKVSK